jgi:thioesterase domain-containing protein
MAQSASIADIVPAVALGFSITEQTADHVALYAPLHLNVNDKGTAFGGSISSALLLAGWTLIVDKLRTEGIDADVYIHKMSLEFTKPIVSDFDSHARLTDPAAWPEFLRVFHARGRARIEVTAESIADGALGARTEARFVALRKGQNLP